jgi:hypothetical protein
MQCSLIYWQKKRGVGHCPALPLLTRDDQGANGACSQEGGLSRVRVRVAYCSGWRRQRRSCSAWRRLHAAWLAALA